MTRKSYPETIEHRWDILYRDYPEIYNEFASVGSPELRFDRLFDLQGKVVVDAGSGSGLSTFKLAHAAKEVIGVEIEDAMRDLAETEAKRQGLANVRFIKGDARAIPLPDHSADAVLAYTLAIHPTEGFRDFVREAKRVVRPGGLIASADVAPGWYGGHLNDVIGGDDNLTQLDAIYRESGFEYLEHPYMQDFGSRDKILRTYGFIFGKQAIAYIKKHGLTRILGLNRVNYLYTKA